MWGVFRDESVTHVALLTINVPDGSKMKPLCIELFAGKFGWSAGWIEMGGRAIGFDIEHLPHHGPVPKGAELVLQDVLTLHGSQFKNASLILASPPCQAYSWMAMPWSLAKAKAKAYRDNPETIEQLNALFNACFRIQREASEAAGRYIPMVVENVKGAQPWVGRAKAHYGSFYLWADVEMTINGKNLSIGGNILPIPARATKTVGHANRRDGHSHTRHLTNQYESDAIKDGGDWVGSGKNCSLQRRASSKSVARKAASANIAKTPFELSSFIAKCYYPSGEIYEKRNETRVVNANHCESGR